MTKSLLILFSGIFLLLSCEKQDPECFLTRPELSVNGQATSDGNSDITIDVFDNGNISLSTQEFDGASFQWTGPNGFQSDAMSPTITNATSEMSGAYTLSVKKGICVGTATTNITINSVSAPCTPQNNKLVFANNGLNPITFNSVYSSSNSGSFEIRAGGSNGDLSIEFANAEQPQTGVYAISSECPTSFLLNGEVCVSLLYSGYYGRATSGSVYVTRLSNGKYTAVFCDIIFSTSLPFELKASAKVSTL